MLESEFLKECLEQVKGHITELQEEPQEEDIMDHIGFLASYMPDSSTMEEDIIQSLHSIQKLNNNQWSVAKAYLGQIIGMWIISRDLKEQMYGAIKDYSSEKKKYIIKMLEDK